ncbi:molybdenum ABC transporter ATP-binding protein [Roseicyclus sp. F158]|uniref:Molybdenum ABC transporter ATP-binding protein n=1 Tax=Tropicimonas omnivorans TaxID=3075590 RepID=A0ABU3DII6_9RHOB|nr:molybdenum ABC transporter ATP-binding protein [Roseicyclus sp. F158]MDT0683496.1 molybdenum ABC transporter ATP-binding protein [Roseicyclus sp. F158]
MTLKVRIRHALGAFTLDAAFEAPGGVTALFGRSGAGKTTIAHAVAGLIRPEDARIEVAGRVLTDTSLRLHVPPHRRRIGYVFQDGRLFPHMSVAQNLGYARRARPAERARVVEMLGIGHLLPRRPGGLSGGEKQRVAIGRALLSRPDLLVMDEPLAALDEARKAEILPWLERLKGEGGVPILYVSHSVPEVARLATTVVALGGGRVIAAGPAERILADPRLAPVLGLREAGAVLTGIIAAQAEDGLTEIDVPGGRLVLPRIAGAIGMHVRIRIAASDVILSRARPEGLSALNILPARVSEIHMGDGPGVMVALETGGTPLLARITRRSANALNLAPGESCHAVVKSVSVAQGDVGTVPAAVKDAGRAG